MKNFIYICKNTNTNTQQQMPTTDIILALDVHRQKAVVTLKFAYNNELKEAVKKPDNARCSQVESFYSGRLHQLIRLKTI